MMIKVIGGQPYLLYISKTWYHFVCSKDCSKQRDLQSEGNDVHVSLESPERRGAGLRFETLDDIILLVLVQEDQCDSLMEWPLQ